MCCLLVWRARSHRVDLVLASVFLIQAFFALSRVVRVGTSEIDLTTHSAFKSSQLASSMQTENAIFAIMIGLALFARYSVTLVQQLRRLAETDPLTGLLNRRAFEARVQALRAASAPLPTGLIICDIDHFKRVNDRHGHEVGDRTLKAFARLLERETPQTALCARLGGEEFCILVAGLDDEAIRLQAIHLRSAVERLHVATSTGSLRLTASFGYCELAPGDDLASALAEVDAAVYQAKSDGRNLVRRAGSPATATRQTGFV
jgi:diguanylate cyclase (GGDEF)-like protein